MTDKAGFLCVCVQICDNFNCMGDYDVSSILTPHEGITFYNINDHGSNN